MNALNGLLFFSCWFLNFQNRKLCACRRGVDCIPIVVYATKYVTQIGFRLGFIFRFLNAMIYDLFVSFDRLPSKDFRFLPENGFFPRSRNRILPVFVSGAFISFFYFYLCHINQVRNEQDSCLTYL